MHVLLQGPLVPLHLKKFLSFKKHQIQDKEQVARCTVSVLFNMRWSNKGNQILLGLSTLKELGGGGGVGIEQTFSFIHLQNLHLKRLNDRIWPETQQRILPIAR